MEREMMGPETTPQLPRISLSGLDPNHPSGAPWDAARAEVMRALESFGCFDTIYDGVPSELLDTLFGHCAPELFALPLETKKLNSPDKAYGGFIGDLPGMPYESLMVGDAATLDCVEQFTGLMWPNGNPTFSNTVWNFAKNMEKLDQTVRRMILQSLNVENHYDSHMQSAAYGMRLSKYWVSSDQESSPGMPPHKDMNLMTIVRQHQITGLQVQARDGEWIDVVPAYNSFTVMLGESFEAWSNGRLKASVHRVSMGGSETRYTTVFTSSPKEGYIVQVPEELIDEEHELMFKPYVFEEYMRFRFSEEGKKAENALKAYCGVTAEESEA